MRILLVADMRSPHSIGWVDGLTRIGADAFVASSRRLTSAQRSGMPGNVREQIIYEPSDALSRVRSFTTGQPAALQAVRSLMRNRRNRVSDETVQLPSPPGTGSLELPLELNIAERQGRRISALAEEHHPEIVHALRVPFEGISVTNLTTRWPTAISIWGQDLARQAQASRGLAEATRRALANIQGLHADCQRDLDLAEDWGAPTTAAHLLAAGNMGYDIDIFNAGEVPHAARTTIVCPRGPAPQVNYAGFLRVASKLVKRFPSVDFVGVALSGNALAESIRDHSPNPNQIHLTPYLSAQELADLYRKSLAVVSPSVSDGTPVSVVTGMSCGAIPLVGDIAPLRELLARNLPGALFDPSDELAFERRLVDILTMPATQWTAQSREVQRIAAAGWSQPTTLERVEAWYRRILDDA